MKMYRSKLFRPRVASSIHVRGNILLNLFCSYTISAEVPEWSYLGNAQYSVQLVAADLFHSTFYINSKHFSKHKICFAHHKDTCLSLLFQLFTCCHETFDTQRSNSHINRSSMNFNLVFLKWRDCCPIGRIRWIGQNHSCMNRIQL